MGDHKAFPIKLPCLMFYTKEGDEYSESSEDEEVEEEYYGDNVDDGNGNDDGGDENDEVVVNNENDHDNNQVVEEENGGEDEDVDEEDFLYNRTFYSVVNKKSYKEKNTHKIHPERCWMSSQGWSLIYEYETSNCFLLNPITMQQVQLPLLELEENTWNCKLVLSSSPVSPYCVTMLVDFDGRRLLFCKLTSNNDLKWVSYDYSNQLDEMENLTDITFSNGRFYGLSLQNHILAIDIDPHPEVTVVQMERIHEPNPFQYYAFCPSILDSCGDLFYVSRWLVNSIKKLAYISIYKADLVERKWNNVTSIGDRSFLMGANNFSASCSSKDLGLKSDSIYFVGPQSICMGIYNIKESSILTHVPFPKSSFPPLWILPPV